MMFMSLVDQEQLIFPEHLSSPPVFREILIAQSLGFCVVFCRSLFVLLLLTIALSALLQFMASDYFFGIFKLFLHKHKKNVHLNLAISEVIICNPELITLQLLYWRDQSSVLDGDRK